MASIFLWICLPKLQNSDLYNKHHYSLSLLLSSERSSEKKIKGRPSYLHLYYVVLVSLNSSQMYKYLKNVGVILTRLIDFLCNIFELYVPTYIMKIKYNCRQIKTK